LDTFKNDLPLSLAAYNAGENLVMKLQRIPNIRETQEYVQVITSRYGGLQMRSPEGWAEPILPPVVRFWDEKGVLHITNIPPTTRTSQP
jgi:hypothetical protein